MHAGESKPKTLVPWKVMLFNEGSALCNIFPLALRESAMASLEGLLLLAGDLSADAVPGHELPSSVSALLQVPFVLKDSVAVVPGYLLRTSIHCGQH